MSDVLTLETLRAAISQMDKPPERHLYPLSPQMFELAREVLGGTDDELFRRYGFLRTMYIPLTIPKWWQLYRRLKIWRHRRRDEGLPIT